MNDSSIQDATDVLTDQNESELNSHHNKRASKTKKSTTKSSSATTTTAKSSSSSSKRSSSRQKPKQNSSSATKDIVASKKKKATNAAAATTPQPSSSSSLRHANSENEEDEENDDGGVEEIPPQMTAAQTRDLRKLIKESFDYSLKEPDLAYVETLYRQLPLLFNTWDRIGFNELTKRDRIVKFYDKMTDILEELVESEEDLESNILAEIEVHLASIKTLCFDLQIKNVEDPKNKQASKVKRTMLDEESHLRNEVKRLEAEKSVRVNSFKKLAACEAVLCDKLKMTKTQMTKNIPSEADIQALSARIKDMERERDQRLVKMSEYKEQCVNFYNELEVSQSDSFGEQLLFEPADTMTLSAGDMERASGFLEELKHKHSAAQDEIRTLRFKIKELWEKLKIDNLNLKEIVINNSTNNASKRTLCIELRKEYERCVKIKMENMQKYIENVRDEINVYCQKMFIGSKELHALDMLRSTNFNEDLLQLHEQKLEDLKFKYEENESLYEKCGRWIDMWAEFVAFEEKTKDPLRLKQRGYNMLVEEKERKTFNIALPKLEEDIKALAIEYQRMNEGQLFKIFNDSYDDFIYKKRLDHDESKKNQRIEKQIMRTIVNKNETRYGSKPATPLALQRIKRKQQDTLLQTPGSRSKLQKIDATMMTNAGAGSSTQATPSSSSNHLFASKTSTAKSSAYGLGAAKSKLAMNKRKSKTPSKAKLLRRSRQLAAAANAAAAAAASQDPDATVLSSDTTTKTTSLMSTIMSSTNASSCSTNASSNNGSKLKTSALGTSSGASKKCPPVSSSSKFALNYNQKTGITRQTTVDTSKFGITRMTSTASNTFIEEEDLDNIENYPSDSVLSGNKQQAALFNAVSAKLSGGGGAGFQFQAPTTLTSKLHTGETDYLEFTSQLKPVRFGVPKEEGEFTKPTQVLQNHNPKIPTTSATVGTTSTRSTRYK